MRVYQPVGWLVENCAYLNPGLAEPSPFGQLLPGKGVRVVGPLEDGLQRLELVVGEGRPVAPGAAAAAASSTPAATATSAL